MQTDNTNTLPSLLIVDDHRAVLEGLQHCFQTEYRVTLAHDLGAMRRVLRQQQFDVVLLDLFLGEAGDGLHALPELLRYQCRVIMVAGSESQALEDATIRACLQMGAHGYVSKRWELARFKQAIAAVLSNHLAYPQSVLAQALREPRNSLPFLSERETALLNLLLQSPMPSNEEMAAALHISTGRVKNCLTELYSKFKVDSRHTLVQKARELGYFPGIHPARMAGKRGKA